MDRVSVISVVSSDAGLVLGVATGDREYAVHANNSLLMMPPVRHLVML